MTWSPLPTSPDREVVAVHSVQAFDVDSRDTDPTTTARTSRRASPGEGPPASPRPTPKPEDTGDPRLSEDSWARHVRELSVDDLRLMAVSLPVIEQAKGVLIGYFGCDAVASIALLRRLSSTRNVKLRVVAAAVVDAASQPGPERFGRLTEFLRA